MRAASALFPTAQRRDAQPVYADQRLRLWRFGNARSVPARWALHVPIRERSKINKILSVLFLPGALLRRVHAREGVYEHIAIGDGGERGFVPVQAGQQTVEFK